MSNTKICGIICEYNPFHNGHMYQIEEARRLSEADYVVAVMSGDFVQRGEPAIIDKWSRTEMALRCGVDMVLELPTVFSLSSAEYFATGAIDVLKKTGIVTHISFGSENFEGQDGAIALRKIAAETKNGPIVNSEMLKNGASFAAASRNSVVSLPNDVLATEYLRAMVRLDAKLEVTPIKRVGKGHVGEGSAMFIRSLLSKGDVAGAQKYMPAAAFDILQKEVGEGRGPVNAALFSNIILADLRRLGVEGLCEKPFVSEGLEYKIYTAACESSSYDELILRCTSKRYTSSRIRRVAFASMLGIRRKLLSEKVPYIRVLGMRRGCGALMNLLNSKAEVPVVTSKAKFLRSIESVGVKLENESGKMLSGEFCANDICCDAKTAIDFLKVENTAADLYSLAFSNPESRVGASEMTHPLVFVD